MFGKKYANFMFRFPLFSIAVIHHVKTDKLSLAQHNFKCSRSGKLMELQANYSKFSIKCPVLLNFLVWNFLKSLFKRPVPSKKKLIVPVYLFTCLLSLSNVLVWIFWKRSLLNDQYWKKDISFFSNSRSLEWPGLIKVQEKIDFFFLLFVYRKKSMVKTSSLFWNKH